MRAKKTPIILTGLMGSALFGCGLLFLSGEPKNYTNSIGLEFVLIPAGTFVMGSPPDDESAFDWEKPAHQVTISRPFYMSRYEVTQGQWEKLMGNNPSCFKGRNNPVEQVSWEEAQVFIRKLNRKEGTSKYRLPTEAEWEYAARAGSQTRYHFGEGEGNLGEYDWYFENSGGKTHPVGRKKPNAWGLFDTAGNVWEWVNDWYDRDYYSRSPGIDPPGAENVDIRVCRGGGWDGFAGDCRAVVRSGCEPGYRSSSLGFRLAFSPGQ
jgi:formylglycine-generating enzyme required for sulfatase activity